MAYSVFISSTREDIEIARDLARRLKEAGLKVFPVDKSASLGHDISASFKKELHEADEVLVILTGKSVGNHRIISEIGAAHGLSKRVTPILVNVEPNQLPKFITQGFVRFAELPRYISQLRERAEEERSSAA